MPGELVVCPTPIGNLDDVTPRMREALVSADYIACEDTRRTGGAARPARDPPAPRLGLQPRGQRSGAGGRAGAADRARRHRRPGLRRRHAGDLRPRLQADPPLHRPQPRGDGAARALGGAGGPRRLRLPTDRWRFEGFLPRAGEIERVLRSTETVVAFESPRRVGEWLAALASIAPDRPAAVCRELTKVHEEVARGSLGELARRFRGDVKGEIVLVIAPPPPASTTKTSASPSTRSATWSSPALARAPPPASSPRSPGPAPTTSTKR